MFRWVSWRNGRIYGLLFILLFTVQPAVKALTANPTDTTQPSQLIEGTPTPTPTTSPKGNVVTVPQRQIEPVAPQDGSDSTYSVPSVVSGSSGWFPNRDCTQDLRVMPLGNSITAGKGSGAPPNQNTNAYLTGYRYPLDTLLNTNKYNFDFVGGRNDGYLSGITFDYDNQGQPGQRMDEMNLFVRNYLDNNPPDLVLLHIGTNDILQEDSSSVADLDTLLNTIQTYEDDNSIDVPVIVARIINEQEVDDVHDHVALITAFNNNLQTLVNTRISNGDQLMVVNMEPVLDYSDTSPDFYDIWHPNPTGYGKMAPVWFSALQSIWPTCAPEITTTAPNTAVVDELYIYDVTATADPSATYSLVTPPEGMTINPDTGIIYWTPAITQTGQYSITVEATNIAGTDSQQFALAVGQPPIITSTPGTSGVVGDLYTYQIEDTGTAPVSYAFTTTTYIPPTGMSINSNGLISWTPTSGQNTAYTIEIEVKNAFGLDTQQFTIDVTERPDITSSAPLTAVINTLYNYQIVASGDTPITYALTDTTFTPPTGMTINGSGLISWTPIPAQEGAHTIEVQAVNASGVDTQQFTIQVYVPAEVSSSPVTTIAQGLTYNYDVEATGTPAFTFSLIDAPTGMTIDSASGLIKWHVSADYPLGNVNIKVRVSNGGGMDEQTFVIEVKQGYAVYLPTVLK